MDFSVSGVEPSRYLTFADFAKQSSNISFTSFDFLQIDSSERGSISSYCMFLKFKCNVDKIIRQCIVAIYTVE